VLDYIGLCWIIMDYVGLCWIEEVEMKVRAKQEG
jgi:hypothetical protein